MSGAKYCFEQEEFSHSDFQPVRFVTQTSAHVSLEALRDDLKRCFQKVDEELMVLINRDYTDFVKISSDLKGLDEKIAKVRAPLESARATGIELGSATEDHLRSVETALSEKRAVQERGYEISCVVRSARLLKKADRMLNRELGHNRQDSETVLLNAAAANIEKAMVIMEDPVCQKSRSKLITKSRSKVKELIQAVIKRLEVVYGTEIAADRMYGASGIVDPQVISSCFQAYLALGKEGMMSATQVLRSLLVQPSIEGIITEGQLDGPVRGSCSGLKILLKDLFEFLNTTYTNVVTPSHTVLNSPSSNGLCEDEEEIASVFCEGVWVAVVEAVETRLKPAFSPGIAKKFQANYVLFHMFLKDVDSMLSNHLASQDAFRSHPATVRFFSMWSLPIYLQLRRKEMSSALSVCLGNIGADKNLLSHLSSTFLECWGQDVLIGKLVPDFFQISMQMFDKLRDWATLGIESVASGDSVSQDTTGQSYWMATNTTHLMNFLVNWTELVTWIETDYLKVAKTNCETATRIDSLWLLPAASSTLESDPRAIELLRENILDSAIGTLSSRLGDVTLLASDVLSGKISTECESNLNLVKSVVKVYRFQQAKPLPVDPSAHIGKLLNPLRTLMSRRDFKARSAVATKVLSSFGAKFSAVVSECVSEIERSEASLRRLKNAKTAVAGISDLEKIRKQFELDRLALIAEVDAYASEGIQGNVFFK